MHTRSLNSSIRAVGAALAVFVTASAAWATPILSFDVSTAGCFNCTTSGPFDLTSSYSGYTFDGLASSVGATDASGSATVGLGAFSRNNSNYTDSSVGDDFVLQVTFILPVGVDPPSSTFTATLVASGPGTPGTLDFYNVFVPYTFSDSLGSGSFEFRVNDIGGINKNSVDNFLTGSIRNATFTSVGPTPPTAVVPEPGSLLLLGAGLLLAAARARTRLRRR